MALSTIPFSGLGADASNQGVNFRNLIINGDMSIAQRGTSFSSTGDVYVLDRFKLDYVGSPSVRYTVTQDTDTPTGQGFAKSMKFDVTTAEASQSETTRLWTRIEAQNLQMLKYGTSSAETLSLSFWVKSNLTGTFIFWLYQEDSTRSISKSYTISSANTWEKKTITIDADTSGQINNDNGAGLRAVWFLTADQSAYGTSSLQTSWGSYDATAVATGQTNVGSSTSNEFYITGVQLEVGTSASDFEFLPYDVNLNRCMRYCQKNPQKNTSGNYGIIAQGMVDGSTLALCNINPLPVEMRTTASLSSSGSFRVHKAGGASSVSSIAINSDHASSSTFAIRVTTSGITAGNSIFLEQNNDADAHIILDAEF